MTDTDQLVINLLPLRLKLHRIGERLPFTATANPEMLTERLQTILGRGNDSLYESLIVILALFGDADVHHIARNSERHEHHNTVPMRKRLALSGTGLDRNVLQQEIYSFSSHKYSHSAATGIILIVKLVEQGLRDVDHKVPHSLKLRQHVKIVVD